MFLLRPYFLYADQIDRQPDICVLDVMLPNRNGFELAEDIHVLNNDIPIIFLTAKTQTEDVIKAALILSSTFLQTLKAVLFVYSSI